MEYASRDIKEKYIAMPINNRQTSQARFSYMSILAQSNENIEDIFMDSNHLTPKGAQMIGTALGTFLEENW